jgi:hypothetical protein
MRKKLAGSSGVISIEDRMGVYRTGIARLAVLGVPDARLVETDRIFRVISSIFHFGR